jgi:hypothetical protein
VETSHLVAVLFAVAAQRHTLGHSNGIPARLKAHRDLLSRIVVAQRLTVLI